MPTETTEIAAIPTNETELQAIIDRELSQAKSFTIATDDEYVEAGRRRAALARVDKFIGDLLDEEREKAHADWKRLVAKIDGYKKPVEEARKAYKLPMFAWEDKKEQERLAEQKRLEAEAKKKADDEALKKAAIEAEFGDQNLAAKIVEEAAAAPAPVVTVEKSIPKIEGHSSQIRWSATVMNPYFVKDAIARAGALISKLKTKDAIEAAALLREAYQDVQYMAYDQVKLNRQAVATKDALKLGGVVFAGRKV